MEVIMSEKEQISTQPYKGTRDFYPKEMKIRNWFFGKIKDILEKFTYEEYSGPTLEPLELYVAKSGNELANEQTYNFVDRGGRKLAIRPEMTPTVARMVAGKIGELTMPLRWFSIPNLYRYERPQRGRLREHWQVNVDMFGCKTIEADLEILSVAVALLNNFGADEKMFKIKVNNRRFFNDVLKSQLQLNTDDILKVSKAIDRKNKVPKEVYEEYLKEIGLNNEKIELLNSLFKMKVEEIVKLCPDSEGSKELGDLFELISNSELKDYCEFDFSIIRGLDYYTGTVFEVFDESPENNRAMFGGGRYDNLIDLFINNANVSGIGFGFGDVTLENFLRTHNLIPEILNEKDKVLITRFPEIPYIEYVKLAKKLRDAGIATSIYMEDKKLTKQIEYANKEGYTFIVVVGQTEMDSNQVVIKNINTRESSTVARKDFAKFFVTS